LVEIESSLQCVLECGDRNALYRQTQYFWRRRKFDTLGH